MILQCDNMFLQGGKDVVLQGRKGYGSVDGKDIVLQGGQGYVPVGWAQGYGPAGWARMYVLQWGRQECRWTRMFSCRAKSIPTG